MKKILVLLFVFGSLFAVDISPNHFQYVDQGNGTGILKLNLGDIEFDVHDNYKKISYA